MGYPLIHYSFQDKIFLVLFSFEGEVAGAVGKYERTGGEWDDVHDVKSTKNQ